MRYLPHTSADIERLLAAIGVPKIDDLFASIPAPLRFRGALNLPAPLDETALIRHLQALAEKGGREVCFAGGGAYRHYTPAAVNHVLLRSEFYTAYTPYQPEISQGTLMALFEFQTMITRLLGLEVANASMYDGATAAAEAALMSGRVTRLKKLIVSAGLHPQYSETLRTYLKWAELEIIPAPLAADGQTDTARLATLLDGQTAGVMLQSPNYLGVIEDMAKIRELLAGKKTKLIHVFTEPLAFGLIASPGQNGADIACGEGQALGIPVSFGGPGLGLFATTKKDMRAMPGRVCGESVDQDGNRAFCLTLATREQHIRREKATSNICSNQGLMALAATVYMALIGRAGLQDLARLNYAKSEYLKAKLVQFARLPLTGPTFNEFVWIPKQPAEQVLSALSAAGILGGTRLGDFTPGLENGILTCVTELNTREEMDHYVEVVRSL